VSPGFGPLFEAVIDAAVAARRRSEELGQ